MSNSAVLDVAIGLALLFLVFSVAVSRINEMVLDLVNYRGKNLEAALAKFLDGDGTAVAGVAGDPDLAPLSKQLLDGPLHDLRTPPARNRSAGKNTSKKSSRRPSYISSEAFARGILDLLDAPGEAAFSAISAADLPVPAQDAYASLAAALTIKNAKGLQAALVAAVAAAPLTPAQQAQAVLVDQLVVVLGRDRLTQAQALVAGWPDSEFKTKLVSLLQRVGFDRDHLVKSLSVWYDGVMQRVSGWYKRRVQLFLIGYAMALTVAFNVDTIAVTQTLWADPTVRVAAVTTAQTAVAATDATTAAGKVNVTSATAMGLPIGWGSSHQPSNSWPLKVLGWLITIFALSFGAPFWFEVMGRFVNMRAGGPKPAPAASSA